MSKKGRKRRVVYKLSRVLPVPLTETVLQKGDRVEVPKVVRREYKLESTQTPRVSVWAKGIVGGWETFYSRRIRVDA